jgi:hypothetical protein
VSKNKATGRCTETMHWVHWNVTQYKGRAGQLRIVDHSSSNWGHINFDDARFDWNVIPENTPRAGAVYVFRRRLAGNDEPCTGNATWSPDEETCEMEFQAKVQASDKRPFDEFGFSIALDDKTVSDPRIICNILVSYIICNILFGCFFLHFVSRTGSPFVSQGILAVGAANSIAMDQEKVQIHGRNNTGEKRVEQAGAVFLFKRENELRDGLGKLLAPPYWASYEQARMQARDFDPRDHFGKSVALAGESLFVGAPDDDGKGIDGGAAYFFDTEFMKMGFRQKIFSVMENDLARRVEVNVRRDLFCGGNRPACDLENPATISYSTSDITAIGVDQARYDDCMNKPITQRTSICGDYLQTSGELHFKKFEKAQSFFVNLIEDNCYEHYMETLLVTLSLPGAGPLQGELYRAIVRIDDDDYDSDPCF